MKYQLALDENLQGVGMWALGYDGGKPELWGALRDLLGSSTPPPGVVDFRAENIGGGIIRVKSSISPDATGYRVYIATERDRFRLRSTLSQPQVTYSDLSPDSTYFFKVTAINQFGESSATEVLGVAKASHLADVLVVNGFDRLSVSGNTRDFVIEHGKAIKASGYTFDAASNDAVVKGLVDIKKYQIVDWILGQESTNDETFNDQEQQIVQNFLEGGGRLFVSGSEIGWDLDYKGSSDDKNFYHNYLKAFYVVDKVSDNDLYGTADGIFNGLDFSYGNGSNGVYQVGYPDGINASAGSIVCLKYNSEYNAGTQFIGAIGSNETRIINFGIPFETIYPETARNQVMARILSFLQPTSAISADHQAFNNLPNQPLLYQNYPNPFNQATTLKFYLPQAEKISLKIYNLLGEAVKTFYEEELVTKGVHQIDWNGVADMNITLSSGVYFYRLETDNYIASKRLLYLK